MTLFDFMTETVASIMNTYGWPGLLAVVIVVALFFVCKYYIGNLSNNIKKSTEKTNIEIQDGFEKLSNKLVDNNQISLALTPGRYRFKKCYLESSCPNFSRSYMDLNADGTVTYYVYITLDISGDTYYGTYEIKNNFLYLYFDKSLFTTSTRVCLIIGVAAL